MTKKKQAPLRGLDELTPAQRWQIGSVLDCLTDASAHLAALIEQEPEGLRDLLIVRTYCERLALVLMDRYADPVPPAPAAVKVDAA